ncbi:MAG: GNAT family N-acetyltransferase [Myxococcota bacterium]
MSLVQTQPPQNTASGFRLVPVDSDDARARWRSDFIGAYQAVFSRAPYFERFSPAEAEGVWTRLTGTPENITLIAATPTDQIVGFGIAIPLRAQAGVAQDLTGLVSVPDTMYFAEIGVLPKFRGQGVGGALIRERLRRIDQERYSGAVLRAPASRDGAFELYSAMGFEEMGVSTDVSTLRTDGRVTTDRRVFLHCILSQLRLDAAPAVP